VKHSELASGVYNAKNDVHRKDFGQSFPSPRSGTRWRLFRPTWTEEIVRIIPNTGEIRAMSPGGVFMQEIIFDGGLREHLRKK